MTVVDTGVPTSRRSFWDALGGFGRKPDAAAAVVPTHGHFDAWRGVVEDAVARACAAGVA